MSFEDPRYREVFFQLHQGLPREGPGSDASTRRALEMCRPLPASPRVLDLGCGPGAQTLVLARELPGATLTAVDQHRPFLEELARRRAVDSGMLAVITTMKADISQLSFAPGSFDLIWCEGAAYNIGFAHGLRIWRPLLADGGRLALSELVWTSSQPPTELKARWQAGYPAMTTVEGCLRRAVDAGYEVLESFILPESDWWDDYYRPLESRCAKFESAGKLEDEAARKALLDCREEIAIRRSFSSCYGYLFLVLRPAV